MSIMVNNLNKIIDVNYYPVPETELSNKKHRPMGIGVQGLADVFAKMKMPFDSPQAKQLNKDMWQEVLSDDPIEPYGIEEV
jgi:ribonucleotide reductase alpha subunit